MGANLHITLPDSAASNTIMALANKKLPSPMTETRTLRRRTATHRLAWLLAGSSLAVLAVGPSTCLYANAQNKFDSNRSGNVAPPVDDNQLNNGANQNQGLSGSSSGQLGQSGLSGGQELPLSPRLHDMLKNFKPLELPPEPAQDHNYNKVLDLGPLHQSTFLAMPSLKPIRLEASYNEPLTLRDALTYAIRNNLPIRISRESWLYQKYQYWGELVDFLPNFSMSWNLTNSQITNTGTNSDARVFQTGLRFPVFLGGNVVYTALAQYYREKGWRQSLKSTINDSLLDVYQKYNNLVLNNALLQIRGKALEISQAQLELNNALYQSGTGTQFAIMQSRTQLAEDRQTLLQQQATTRMAAMALAFSLNMPMAINLVPADDTVSEASLIVEKPNINELVGLALVHRPELRQYELFRLAAARNVQVAASLLYPQMSFFTTFTHSSVSVFPSTGNLNGVANAQITSFNNGNGLATNTALNQTAGFSPTSGSTTATSGANTGATTVVAGGGGTPINNVQSGSLVTSGAVAPSIATSTSGNVGNTANNVTGANTAGAGVFGGLFNTFQAGFTINWSLANLGLGNVANILSARALSRQALLQANQELLLVTEQVRTAYLNAITAREQIDNAAYGVASAGEALRLANLRLRTGMGTNLELITAQRDYVNSLSNQAQAIIASNQAQAQILHETGLISLESLTRGYR
jgi:outer membrane protein TolC